VWDRWILRCGAAASRHPRAVLLAMGLCLAVGLAGATRLRFSWDPLSYLPESEPVRVATEVLDREMGGSSSFEVLVDTGVANGFHDPELLARLEALRSDLASPRFEAARVAKTLSLSDVLKEIHQALNENRPEYYAIPEDRRLVAQELLLFENTGTDDLEDVVDAQFRLGSFTGRIPRDDAMRQVPVLDAIEARFREVIGDGAEVAMTGALVLGNRSFFAMIRSMAESYVIALVVVTPMMILMLGNLRGGLLSMIPNVTPVVLTLGLMGWLRVPIDFSTMMSGAVVLGIAVDDTIHFTHNFQRFYARGEDAGGAVTRALDTAGRAMLFTSIVLGAGFLIYTFSAMANLVNLGIFTAFAIATAFLADVLVAPALMVLFLRQPRHAGAPARNARAAARVSPGTPPARPG
jgi:predicted RND superfamily exporter protein